MPDYRLSATARRQIARVLAQSEREFGTAVRERYATLFVAAMRDVATDPGRPGVRAEPAIDAGLRTYHLGNSRSHVPAGTGRIGKPRHALVFQVASDGIVDILGIIHDRMDRPGAVRRILAPAPEKAE